MQISQLIKLLNIIADQVYIGKFDPEVGVTRIEQKIIEKRDTEITNAHLIAYRMSKEEVLYNWLQYLKKETGKTQEGKFPAACGANKLYIK